MEYTTLGRTGERISKIGFGGATAGIPNYITRFDPEKTSDREPIIEAIHYGLEHGITYFDTAFSYGQGASERIFGEALEGFDKKRFLLGTKMGNYDPAEVRKNAEQSLRNLRRDYVDLLQIHSSNISNEQVDGILKKGGMLDELLKLKTEGLVRYVGFSAEAQTPALYRLIERSEFDTMQILYNFLFQHPYDPYFKAGCLYDAKQAGIGVLTMRATTSGIFQKWINHVNPRNDFDYTPSLIQFDLSCPFVDTVIIGMRSVSEVEANIAVVDDSSGRIDIEALHNRRV